MTRATYIVLVYAGFLVLAVAVRASPIVGPAEVRLEADTIQAPERALYIRVCAECHDLERTESLRRTESEWRGTIYEMIDAGAEATDSEYQTILDFLVSNYGAVAVNRAPAEDLVTVLAISKEDGDAIVAYRTTHGDFDDFDELTKVPGIDLDKLEARKASLRFF
jgi:competence ComEA-like helix-hairpin-helix protein